VDLFGSEAAAGKSLGTDLAKGKLTLPVLLLWERADERDRRLLNELVQNWQKDSIKSIAKLLAQYETLSSSLKTIHQYLETARVRLRSLPGVEGRSGLFGLTGYLASQTDALGICG
jgi:octaprenyl-diphosphate synthase